MGNIFINIALYYYGSETTSLVFPAKEMPLQTITLPPPYAVTLSIQQSAKRSPGPIQTRTIPSTLSKQNMTSSENITLRHSKGGVVGTNANVFYDVKLLTLASRLA